MLTTARLHVPYSHCAVNWPSRVCWHWPIWTSHARTVLSHEPDAIREPSGENTTLPTESEWPSSVCWHRPVCTSQTRTVMSLKVYHGGLGASYISWFLAFDRPPTSGWEHLKISQNHQKYITPYTTSPQWTFNGCSTRFYKRFTSF
jgi:hypothetical protein